MDKAKEMQYKEWCERHSLPEHQSREAFEDAASLYLVNQSGADQQRRSAAPSTPVVMVDTPTRYHHNEHDLSVHDDPVGELVKYEDAVAWQRAVTAQAVAQAVSEIEGAHYHSMSERTDIGKRLRRVAKLAGYELDGTDEFYYAAAFSILGQVAGELERHAAAPQQHAQAALSDGDIRKAVANVQPEDFNGVAGVDFLSYDVALVRAFLAASQQPAAAPAEHQLAPVWTYNVFEGPAPQSYKSWNDWMMSTVKAGAFIRAASAADYETPVATPPAVPAEQAQGQAAEREIPSNEVLEELWNTTHYGHPADFAADVLERWGGWMHGVLGYGGSFSKTTQQGDGELPPNRELMALLEMDANTDLHDIMAMAAMRIKRLTAELAQRAGSGDAKPLGYVHKISVAAFNRMGPVRTFNLPMHNYAADDHVSVYLATPPEQASLTDAQREAIRHGGELLALEGYLVQADDLRAILSETVTKPVTATGTDSLETSEDEARPYVAQHASDCSTNNRGVPELLGSCDCYAVPSVIPDQAGDIFYLIREWARLPEGQRGDMARQIIGQLNKSYTAGVKDTRALIAAEQPPAPVAAADLAQRAIGRAEAMRIIMDLNAEDGIDEYIGSHPSGDSGEWDGYWKDDKLRTLLRVDDTAWSLVVESENKLIDFQCRIAEKEMDKAFFGDAVQIPADALNQSDSERDAALSVAVAVNELGATVVVSRHQNDVQTIVYSETHQPGYEGAAIIRLSAMAAQQGEKGGTA